MENFEYVQAAYEALKADVEKSGVQVSLDFEVDEHWITLTLSDISIFAPDYDITDDIKTLLLLCHKYSHNEYSCCRDWDGSDLVNYGKSIFINLFDKDGCPIDPDDSLTESLVKEVA